MAFPMPENQDVEYKQEYTTQLRKEVVAFANADGGTIYVGVRKDGTVCGVDSPDDIMVQIANSLKDSIAPDIMPFVNIKAVKSEGKEIIELTVNTGTNRPYYIREKGLKPSGVYIRKGSSAQPVSDEGIRNMIIEANGSSFELSRSLNQELTFDALKKEMEKRDMEFGEAQLRTLKLVGEDGLYTNLALLLSDQCEATTKVAVFQGKDKEIFRNRKEFSGSLMQQMNEVYDILDRYNQIQANFSKLDRIDEKDYPEEALREAWLNCLVHRDYSFSGSTIINIYDDRIEFISLGGLVPGLTLNTIFLGVSQSRNPNLAAIFYRMRLIESYGTGIRKIKRECGRRNRTPLFEVAEGGFRVTLYNCNEDSNESDVLSGKKRKNVTYPIADEKEQIIDYVHEHGYITRRETEKLISSGTTKAFTILKGLCADDKLREVGNGRLRKYVISEDKFV